MRNFFNNKVMITAGKFTYLDLGVFIIGALCIFGIIHSSNDNERYLRVLATTEIQEAGILKDQMWEMMAKETKISKNSFDSIYPEIMEKPTEEALDIIQKHSTKINSIQRENLSVGLKIFKKKMTQQQRDIETALGEHSKLINDPFYSLYIRDNSPINYDYLIIKE